MLSNGKTSDTRWTTESRWKSYLEAYRKSKDESDLEGRL